MRSLLIVLSAASGVCGIAYEVLYARAFTTWLGDMFHVGAAVLSAFLLGIALGARVAHRFARWLWLVEALIGVWAIGFALTFHSTFARFAESGGLTWTTQPAVAVGFVFVLLLPPALLVGFSVPLFSLWLEETGADRARAFSIVYSAYNIGAACFVLVVELLLLVELGLRGALLSLGVVNLVISVALVSLTRGRTVPPPEAQTTVVAPTPVLRALFAVSVASGLFQLFFLKVSEHMFGPYRENFAGVVALGLFGIAAGTWAVRRYELRFVHLLFATAGLAAFSGVMLEPVIWLRAWLIPLVGDAPWAQRALKLAVIAFLGGPALAGFGATVPALLAEHTSARRGAGHLLFLSGLGNVAGYLAAGLGAYALLSSPGVVALVIVVCIGSGASLLPSTRARASWLATAALLASVTFAAWPTALMSISYLPLRATDSLSHAMEFFASTEERRHRDSTVHVVTTHAGDRALIINGYPSLQLGGPHLAWLRETIFGMAPALYAQNRDKALVLGLGIGLSANGATAYFDKTKVIEINPTMIDILPEFAELNGDLLSRDEVEIVVQDGLAALYDERERYDAIINTVTSPLFFSSSKLYTADFFALAKSRLNPGGVYALWFDGRVGLQGTNIVFETVRQSFANCALVVLADSYVQLICSDEPLRPHALGQPRGPVAEFFRENWPSGDVPSLINALAFPGHSIFEDRWNADVNTFDRPVLEHAMATVDRSQDEPMLMAVALVDVYRDPTGRLDTTGFAERCARARRLDVLSAPCVTSMARRNEGRLPRAFMEAVLRLDVQLKPAERALLIAELMRSGDLEFAHAMLGAADENERLSKSLLRSSVLLQLAQKGDVDDKTLHELAVRSPIDPETAQMMSEVHARRMGARPPLSVPAPPAPGGTP